MSVRKLTNKQIERIATEALTEWEQANGEADLRAYVTGELNRQRNNIILRALGFERDWKGDWKIDHCNGRASVIDGLLKSAAHSAIEAWLAEQLGNLPQLAKQQITELKREYSSAYISELSEALREEAHRKAQADAESVIARITAEPEEASA